MDIIEQNQNEETVVAVRKQELQNTLTTNKETLQLNILTIGISSLAIMAGIISNQLAVTTVGILGEILGGVGTAITVRDNRKMKTEYNNPDLNSIDNLGKNESQGGRLR